MSEDNLQRTVISDAEFYTVLKTVQGFSSDFKKNEFLDQYFYHNRALTSDMLGLLMEELSFSSSRAELVIDLEGKVVPPKKRKLMKVEKKTSVFLIVVAITLSTLTGFIAGLTCATVLWMGLK